MPSNGILHLRNTNLCQQEQTARYEIGTARIIRKDSFANTWPQVAGLVADGGSFAAHHAFVVSSKTGYLFIPLMYWLLSKAKPSQSGVQKSIKTTEPQAEYKSLIQTKKCMREMEFDPQNYLKKKQKQMFLNTRMSPLLQSNPQEGPV